MHSPSARALRHLDRYYIILVRTLKHLIPAKCAINITYLFIYIVRPTAPGWPRATRKRSRPDHTCKYIIRIYTCIHMYTYVYTWSKLAYCESNNASHGNDKRGYREATETPREATEAPRRPRRSPLSPTKATEIIVKTALQIPAF